MKLPIILDIKDLRGQPIDFKIAKGEIIYLKYNDKSIDLFKALLNPNLKIKANGQTFGKDLAKLSKEEVYQQRQKIGFVDNKGFLLEDETIEKNLEFYIDALTIDKLSAITRFNSFRKTLYIKRGSRINELSQVQLFCFRICLCLAKQPDILLVENPLTQLDPESYIAQMDTLYDLIRRKGLTYIASLSDQSIIETYPGRYVEL